MATKTSQRVAIFIIALVMLGGTIGFYFLSIAEMNQASEDQKQQTELMAKYQKQMTCSTAAVEAPAEVAPEVPKLTEKLTGLESSDLTAGTGAELKTGSCAIVKYYGTLATDGSVFDENYTTATTAGFIIGEGNVIEGWDKGLIGMKEGGVRRLSIPSAMGYKDQAQEKIPANSDLIFTIKLVKVQ